MIASCIAWRALSTSKDANRISKKNAADLLNVEKTGQYATHPETYEQQLSESVSEIKAARKALGVVAGTCLSNIKNQLTPYQTSSSEGLS